MLAKVDERERTSGRLAPEDRALIIRLAAAVKLAQTVVDTDDAAVALKGLGKLDIVREDREVNRGNRVTVIVGMPGAPVKLPDLSIPPELSDQTGGDDGDES